MNQTGAQQDPLAVAREEIGQLRADLKTSEKNIARLLQMFEEQQRLVNSQQATLVRMERVLMDVVTGRVWRTLRAAGGVIKKVIPGGGAHSNGTSHLIGRRNTYLVCDEPLPDECRPRSGKITVRGWTVAEGGVECVQVHVGNLPPMEAKPCIPRPDVQKSLPGLDKSGQAGFSLVFDSKALAKGRHPILLRAVVNGEVVRENKTFVDIDHDGGFVSDYHRWIHEFERHESQLLDLKVSSLAEQPLISIIMPVYNTEPKELAAAIDSVVTQSYGHWELCICDDCSSRPAVRKLLEDYAAQDPRIKVHYAAERGGISRASNLARKMANGQFIALLDHDDTLAPHALASVCEAINQNPLSGLFYSDEDKIDGDGVRFDPFFKPDWAPDLFLSENYICHLLVMRRDLADKLGGFNPALDGSQDYDLVLRASELAVSVHHIPKVLYHWRAGAASTASATENKSYALEAARLALRQHCERTKAGCAVEAGAVPGRWRVRYPVSPGARVSIIIASGGNVDILRTNIASLFAKTSYADYEVVIADNSKGNAIEKLVNQYQASHANLRYIDWRNKPFNFSAINNAAARQCDAPLLLFLNDDTSVIEPAWLEAMAELAMRPEVGAVGAKLLYPNGAIQHAGVVMGIFDNCGHAFKGLNGAVGHYFDFSDVIRNVSAVTGACLMARASVFWQVGGFDETQFAVAFNDVDLCLKMGAYGYRVLYTPHAVLYHHESLSKTSRDLIPRPAEVAAMKYKWEKVIAHDPYYSPNLTRVDEDYSLRTRV
jgi:GT2 family glycosyltransferase